MRRATTLCALAAAVLAAGATIVLANNGSAAPNTATTSTAAGGALGGNWFGAAPYVMPLDNNPPDLGQVMAATGQKSFELSFVLAGGGCTAAWDGTAPVSSDTTVAGDISTVRAAGGDVSVSFGGYNGTKLGQSCSSAAATAAAEQAVIDKYSLKAIDLDLEEPEYENTAAINNEVGAAQILQKNNPGLYISITTAGTPTAGTGYFGQQLLNTAKGLGFAPDNFSIMPFDNGFNGASTQIDALNLFHGLLMNTFGWDSATAFRHEGFSGMNGRTDAAEYFRQADFQSVFNYATTNGLGRFTYWSLNRDRQCTVPDNNGMLSGTCSSVAQNPWEFTTYTARFGGAALPPPPTTTTPPTTGGNGGACTTLSPWNATSVYTGGMSVSFKAHKWTAKWWTQNDTPGGTVGVWTDNGPC